MPDALDSTSPASASRDPCPPVYVDVSDVHDFRVAAQWFLSIGLGAAYLVLLVAWWLLTGQTKILDHETPFLIFIAAVFAVSAIVVGVVCVNWKRQQRQAGTALGDRDNLTLNRAVIALLEEMGGIIRFRIGRSPKLKHCTEFQKRLGELGYPRVTTIVDERFGPTIRKIEISDQFLEPETILSQAKRWSGGMVFLAVLTPLYLAFFLWVAWSGMGNVRMLPMVGIVVFFGAIPLARSFGVRIGESLAPVVSMGVVEDRKGRRWTVDDSCIFVFKSKSGKKKITIDLTGPAGLLTMRFWNTDDAGFLLLWQRWNHPHPRTELG